MGRAGFDCGFVQPNQVSAQRLGPGTYSLSSRSNVPYVKLEGQNMNKIFSWGEIIDVPSGQQVSVRNSSYHAGDIYINSGCDYDNRPARITVPVPFTVANQVVIGITTYWVPTYPADVRIARRAYIAFDAAVPPASTSLILVIGIRSDGSHNTADEIQPTVIVVPGVGYTDEHSFVAGELLGLVPLGHLALQGDETRPHALLTTATPYVQANVSINLPDFLPNAYYVMEY